MNWQMLVIIAYSGLGAVILGFCIVFLLEVILRSADFLHKVFMAMWDDRT